MTEEQQLLEAVLADPENEDSRQRYLGWLRGTHDPEKMARAQILEAQYAMACKPAGDPHGGFVSLPETALGSVEQFGEQWFGRGLRFLRDWWELSEGIEVTVAQ